MKDFLRRVEKVVLEIPDWLIGPIFALMVCYVIFSCMQFMMGVGDAPKSRSMCRIEFVFPGYQIGLWAGTRVNGEARLDR